MKVIIVIALALSSVGAFADSNCDLAIKDLIRVSKGVGAIEQTAKGIGNGPTVMQEWKDLVASLPKALEAAETKMRESCNLSLLNDR